MDERRQELQSLKENVFNDLTLWNRKYLHYNSVSNFIEHFDSIKNKSDKAWIFDTLYTYLTFCDGIAEDISRQESCDIFSKYLIKVSHYYRYSLSFRMVGNRVVYFLDYLVVFVGLWLIFNIYIALSIIPLLVYHQRRIKDRIKRKVCYGLFY